MAKVKEKEPTNKIVQAEIREVMRSQMTPAPYNPRAISDEARKQLKNNLKRVGLLGGIIWNEDTTNIVSGHQRVSIMDEVNKYNPETHENDYPVKVSVVHFDEKTEKEQVLFANNKNAQGVYDDDLLRKMLSDADVDYRFAGFDDFDMQMLGLTDDTQEMLSAYSDTQWRESHITGTGYEAEEGAEVNAEKVAKSEQFKADAENTKINRDKNFYEDTPDNQLARHAEIQKIKDRINKQNDIEKDGGLLSYVVISFQSPSECAAFLESFGYAPGTKYIQGDEFSRIIEFGDPLLENSEE